MNIPKTLGTIKRQCQECGKIENCINYKDFMSQKYMTQCLDCWHRKWGQRPER